MKMDKQTELDYLKKRIFIFADFFIEKYNLDFFKNVKPGLEVEYEKSNLRGLRLASKDFNNWIREIPVNDAIELGEILKKELGEDLSVIEQKRLRKISQVVKKGKIKNLDEYELLSNRVDEIYTDSDKADEVKKLNNLLVDFNLNNKPNLSSSKISN